MAVTGTFVFNVAKGRAAELHNNVKSGSPANSRLLACVWESGVAVDDDLEACDTIAAVTALTGMVERTANGWSRHYIAAADLATIASTLDDTADVQDLDITADQSWTPTNASDTVDVLIIAYCPDGVTPGADSTFIPLTCHQFAVTPDGSQVTAQFNAEGYYRAS